MEELLESDVCRNPKNVRVLLIALIFKKNAKFTTSHNLLEDF